jgi:hypothetical protein
MFVRRKVFQVLNISDAENEEWPGGFGHFEILLDEQFFGVSCASKGTYLSLFVLQ